MDVRSFYLVASSCFCLALSCSAFAAKIQPVYSLKNLGDQVDVAGTSFQKVEVKCNTGRELRYVHRTVGAQEWCVNGNSLECFDERIDAATRACSVAKKAILGASSVAATESISASVARAEKLRVEDQRDKLEQELIANQQKKIELRTRQLELRKRQLELQTQQDNN
jgi:hypothetical protein